MLSEVALSRIVRATPATLRFQLVDADGQPDVDDDLVVDVSVVSSAGDAVVSGVASVDAGTGGRTLALSRAATARIDRLTATWSTDIAGEPVVLGHTVHDVVGGVFYTTGELRETSAGLKLEAKHSDAELISDRAEVEYQFEAVSNRAFVPRFDSTVVDHVGGRRFRVGKPDLLEVVWARWSDDGGVSWVDVDVDGVPADDAGVVNLPVALRAGVIHVGFVHGAQRPTPELKRLAMLAARYRRSQDQTATSDPRATSIQTQFGVEVLAVPGTRQWVTAIPEVDEFLNRPSVRWEELL